MKLDIQDGSVTEKNIESEYKFVFKFIFSLFVAIILVLPSIFFPKLREKTKKPFLDLFHFLISAKITLVLVLLNLFVFFVIQPFIQEGIINSISSLTLKVTGVPIIDILFNVLLTGFIHGDYSHILWNMLSLFIFGRIIEKYLLDKYLLIYFGALFLGNISSFLLEGPVIGASGAISGLIFASILIKPLYFSFIALLPMPVFIIGWIGIYGDFASFIARSNDGIAHLAHIGGYIAGFIVALFFAGFNKKEEVKKGIIINIIGFLLLLFWFFVLKK
jgi:membrane associated rhomboid family serine protease